MKTQLQLRLRVCILSLLLIPSWVRAQYTVNEVGTHSIDYNNPTFIYPGENDLVQIPIDFDFAFFGNTYTECYVAENGFITFDQFADGGCCEGQSIPNNSDPDNLIAPVWTDMDDQVYSIHYELFGDAPNRWLAITFDLTDFCGAYYYGQVKLFETTNVIEIHTQKWAEFDAPCVPVTQGIEGPGGVIAYPVPGRNATTDWAVSEDTSDYVAFVPLVDFGNSEQYIVDQNGVWDPEYNLPIQVTIPENGYSDPIAIPFDFTFYGTPYNSFRMAEDGFITFNNPIGDTWLPQTLPNPADPNNIIAGLWADHNALDCMYGGCYSYEVLGDSPNRRMIISYYVQNVCGEYVESQIKLFEAGSIIELHTYYDHLILEGIQGGGGGGDLGCSVATQGIESSDGTAANFIEGRNNSIEWTAVEDFVRFTPVLANDAGILFNINEYCEGTQDIKSIVTNFGGNTIDSVVINWSWNGVEQTPVETHFPMEPQGNYQITLGPQTLTIGDVDTLVTWTSEPNGTTDPNNTNDSQTSFIQPALHGVYTIGGSDPDYVTFNDAIVHLDSVGVCDTVIFNVRPGTYNEQIVLSHINGAFGKKIIFRAENGDSSSVILQYNSTSSGENYVVSFWNAHDYILEDMTINALNSSFGRVIALNFFSFGNIIRNCAINGKSVSTTSLNHACVYSDQNNSDNKLIHNTISNGSYGFYHFTPTDQLASTGIRLIENQIINYYVDGIRTDRTTGLDIQGNFITTTSNYGAVRGIYVSVDFDTLSVSGNEIYLPNGYEGITLTSIDPDASTRVKVFNNVVNMPDAFCNFGIGLFSCENVDLYHNTVSVGSAFTTDYAFVLSGGQNDSIYNNIFVNTGGGSVVFATNNLNHLDFNSYYSTGSNFGHYQNTNNAAPDLHLWTTISGFDGNSLAADPLFVSSIDLHTTNSYLNASGSTLFTTQFDFDLELRNSDAPDIGADEFDPPANDAAASILLSPIRICTPEQNVEFVLHNLGLDSLNEVTIEWSVNSILQTPAVLTPALAPEGDTAHVSLGGFVFSDQPDTLRIWTSMPNNSTDGQQSNDTLEHVYRLPLNGTYTIGGTDPDFPTLSAAAAALKEFTICGPVVFSIRDGIYTEQVLIDSIVGSSETNTITFESESTDSSAVLIQYSALSASNYVVRLNGTDYVTFRHLGFKSLDVCSANVLDLRNGVHHFTLENCYLEGSPYACATSACVSSLAFGFNEYYTVRNNYFLNGQQGVLYILGGSERAREMAFEDNIFVNQRLRAIDVNGVRGVSVRNNMISTNVVGAGYVGIEADGLHLDNTISGNTVLITGSGGDGMFLNTINIFLGQLGVTRVFNNMVSTNSGSGIRLWNAVRTQIYFNNVWTGGTNTSNHHAFELVGGDTLDIKNNVFVANAGTAFRNYLSVPPIATSDYNDLLSSGASVGQWAGVNYSDLPAWQTATGLDVNSMSIDPQFVSTTDLHVLADTLDGAGMAISGISTDFDGEPRNAIAPDIGADEIGANDNDAGIIAMFPEMPFARGNQEVKAVLRNYGGNSLDTVDIHWELNGIVQTTYHYDGSLMSLTQDTVVLGVLNFQLNTPYDFRIWTSAPNSTTDLYNSNDTLIVLEQYAAVSDTVTIGGTSPDVSTIQAALTAMTYGGVLDSVHFQLRSGTYTEALVFPHTAVLGCGVPVIFESESGDPEDVIWINTALGAPTLTLNGADGLTFRNLTIQTVLNTHQAVVVQNSSNCNTFEGCHLTGVSTTSTANALSIVYSASGVDNNNAFINNVFTNGSYGIWWQGFSDESGTLISNNQFINQYYRSIYLQTQNAPQALKNTITTTSNPHGGYIGIFLASCDNQSVVAGNDMSLLVGTGIASYYCLGTAMSPALYYNNFIIIGETGLSYGIDAAGANHLRLYNNTIKIAGTNPGSRALNSHFSSNLHIVNNIMSNEAEGVVIRLINVSEIATSNFNNLLTTGATLVQTDAAQYADLETWQTTGRDTNSVSVDPQFADTDDLHVLSSFLNGAATPLDAVTIDIDGDPRDTLTPDIGADEFDLFSDDVGILSINYPTQPFPSGVNTVFIKFVNNGQDTLTSMQVDWEADGILQPTYYWTGLLPSSGTYDSLDIGTYNFAPYDTHTLKIWVSAPNGMTDGLASNDTLESNTLYPALLGEYTIGGSGPDFDSIAQALRVLHRGGAAGPVTFNIRTGTYLEPLTITSFPGCGCDTPVVFQSESGDSTDVTITNLGFNNTTLTLDGADGVIFQNLTLTSVNPAFRNVIFYANGAHCNQFLNNRIVGYEGNSFSSDQSVIWSNSSLDTGNVFRNNWIRFGSYGFYLVGNASANANTLIENNFLDQNYSYGIYANQELGMQILSNTVSLSTGNTTARGIQLDNSHGPIRVLGNDVRVPSGRYGIVLSSCTATSMSYGLVANNFVSVGGDSDAYGVYLNDLQYQDVVHNNVHVYSNTASATNNAGLYLTNNTSLHLRNNVIANSSPGWSILAGNNPSFTSDDNDFYATGTNLGHWNGADQADLSAWQSVSGQDANSLSQNPQFMSDIDLHVANILLDGEAAVLSYITTDIDGESRDTLPDIGADEFNPAANDDAGVFMLNGPVIPFAHGVQPVEIALKNFGANTLTSATVRWVVNGMEQPSYAWTGSLAPAQCAFITIGNYNFAEHSDHDIVFWSEMPNGVTDSTNVNDTLYIDDLYPALNGMYTVGGVLPDFNLFSQVEDALNIGGILGNVTFNIRNGIYSTQLSIADFPRTSYAHEVLFQSESGDSSDVTILRDFVNNINNYTVSLADAHHVKFLKLTLKSTLGRVLSITNGSSNIDIEHCRILGVQATYANADLILVYSTTSTEDSLYIVGNRFELGSYGLYLVGSPGDPEKDVLISGNHFHNCHYRSIHVHNHDGLIVDNNSVFNDYNSHEGIALTGCSNTKSISGNDIRIYEGGSFGLFLHYVSGTMATPALISNNFILIAGGNSVVHGIYHAHGNYNNIYHNTVRIENTHGQSNAFTDDNTYNNIHVRNCVFANHGGGRTVATNWYTIYHTNTMDYCDLFSTGPVLAYWGGDFANLTALQAFSNQNLNSTDAEPLFADDGFKVLQVALDGTAIVLSSVTTDIEGESRNMTTPDIGADEFTPVLNDIGAKLLVSPATYCGLSDMEEITIRIQNFGSDVKAGFNVAYSLDGSGWHVESVGALMVQPGQTLDFTFTPTEDLSETGTYTFALRTALEGDTNLSNDTLWDVEVEHIPALVEPVSNMIPADNAMEIEKPTSLSWNPAPNATLYDVYIWESSLSQPVMPQIPNLAVINTSYPNVEYGETYSWQVVAKNVCGQTQASGIQAFTVRELPDLVVDSISIPLMAVSGQEIEIEWQVKNIGTGHTQSTLWTDAVYLSLDATLNTSFDTYLGGVQNLSALQPEEAYLQTGMFTIPQGFTGEYYVFVYSDRFSNLIESSNSNNWDRTSTQMHITLLPPPDLVIDQVVTPLSAFSGQSISVQYTGRNNGTGDIDETASWKDRIKISEDGLSSSGGTILHTLTINGPLDVEDTYQRTVNVTLPNAIFGEYYIYVETDIQNDVYEQAAENNNYGVSDTMQIFLTPPPNLIVTNAPAPDTLHSNALWDFTWTVENAGGTSPVEAYWYDAIYLSPSPIYNTNFLSFIAQRVKYGPFNPTSTYSPIAQERVPVVNEGEYYLYYYTDRYNYVFEHTYENDNITRSASFVIVNPDVEPVIDSIENSATSGDLIPFTWDLVNHGPGNVHDRYLKYRYYISALDTFNQELAQEIKFTNTGALTLLADDSLSVQTTLLLPLGLNGQYYIYMRVEPSGTMHEQDDAYSNNIARSPNPIDIDPGPYPDLKTIQCTTPDTISAGDVIAVQYTQINQGGDHASMRGVEAVYISFDSIWDPEYAQLLAESNYATPLQKDSTVAVERTVFVPATVTSNVYYFYIVSDKNNSIFEYTGEDNNIYRSNPVFVNPYPPIDIAVNDVLFTEDTLYSGLSYPIGYEIRSLSAPPLRILWDDAVYFSVDSIFDPELDLLVSVHQVQTAAFTAVDSIDISASLSVPPGVSGDYYILVHTDAEDVNEDANPANNIDQKRNGGLAIPVHVVLSPYPDLVVSAINAPSTAVAGQSFSMSYSIENMGTGEATSWQDRVFLSADATISNGDLQLYSGRIEDSLPPGNTGGDTIEILLPGYLNGNYFLIVRTDFLNEWYEHNGEDNNNTARVLEITAPPPSDLIVEAIALPDSLLAGESTTIEWTTKNDGSNPAQGNIREVVYLSEDTLWNVEDQVFGVIQNQLYLPPQSTHAQQLTAPVIGVINQDYYALVRTDALNNVPEDDEMNNISSSLDPAYIDVKTLLLDSLFTDSLLAGVELYYKLVVDPILEGESILVQLIGDSMHAYNELFISYDDAPTRGDFDISNNKALSGFQQAVIKNAQVGTYYILGYGATDTGGDQEVNLFARVMTYEILTVTPNQGSNKGYVTVVIDGSRLDSTYQVRLRDTTGYVLHADTFLIVSSEKIIATFDLRGTPVGMYNVECQIEPYYVAVLENGFEVIDGMGPDLQVNWYLSPGSTSPRNKPVKILVEMINNGDADVRDQYVRVYSPYGNVMAWSYDDLLAEETFDYLDVPAQLQNGFQGVLPPGNSVMYEVFSWLHPYPFFITDVR